MLTNKLDPQLFNIDVKAHLASAELFKGLDDSILDEITDLVEVIRIPGNETLFQQGAPGDGLYIVINGRLRVLIKREGHPEEVVAEVARDEMVGEMALLTGEPRSATVRATRDSILIRLSDEGCNAIAQKYPFIVLQMARTLAKRLAAMNRSPRMVTPLVNITLIATSHRVKLSQFARQLVASLGEFGSTLYLNSRRVKSIWETEGSERGKSQTQQNVKFENWINEKESKFRFIVYEADHIASSWTRRCLRQADRILLVGNTDLSPDLGSLESELFHHQAQQPTARIELVLVYPKIQLEFSDTYRWLENRQVSAHYHVRLDFLSDFARLARLLSGKAIGLALGGGGLRGLAHIGVIRALEELGIPIDFVGGTSMGSIMAAQFAMGWDYQKMVRENKKMWKDSWPMNDYTFPFMACLSGEKFDQALQMMFKDKKIEDLPLRYFCVSTNLTSASLTIHDDGPVWKRLRGSCSLPGIMPPVFDNGAMLVDGAVLNNVPGDIMKRRSGGRVIAVDVSPREDVIFKPDYPERPPTNEILWRQINPMAEKHSLPSLFDIVTRSVMISNVSNTSRVKNEVELYLDIPLDQYGMSDVKSFDQIIETGYQFALAHIEQWKQNELT